MLPSSGFSVAHYTDKQENVLTIPKIGTKTAFTLNVTDYYYGTYLQNIRVLCIFVSISMLNLKTIVSLKRLPGVLK